MLLYTLPHPSDRIWILDLTTHVSTPTRRQRSGSIYALVVPQGPRQRLYIGATRDLHRRLRHHLALARRELKRPPSPRPRASATGLLASVVTGRCALLVLRLEAVSASRRRLLRRLELAWLLIAAREELPQVKKRAPSVNWQGNPAELRTAFRLAETRSWPGKWIRALTPLCENRALPGPTPAGPTPTGESTRRGPAVTRRGPAVARRRPAAIGRQGAAAGWGGAKAGAGKATGNPAPEPPATNRPATNRPADKRPAGDQGDPAPGNGAGRPS